MDLAYRPVAREELDAFRRTDSYGFGYRHENPDEIAAWAEAELDRTVAAFEGDEPVGVSRNYSLELTMPGGRTVPVAGVSWVSVRPTHRRRGVLTGMIRLLVEDAAERGEPAAVLTASEGNIYNRFGFGIATYHLSVKLDRAYVQFREPVRDGRLRMIEADEALKTGPELFERVRRTRPGAISRPAPWWPCEWAEKDIVKHRFDVLYEREGRVAGHAVYGVDGEWLDGISRRNVNVHDLVAEDPDAEAALFQFLCDLDLTETITVPRLPLDAELAWRIRDPRQVETTMLNDWLWVRPVDVPALLEARTYEVPDRLVIEVRDDFRPRTAGVFELDAGPDGVSCKRTGAAPDLTLRVAELGSISLGGVTASELLRAHRIECDALVARRADRLFAAERIPYSFTWF
jgi:predicted acetyltransferase